MSDLHNQAVALRKRVDTASSEAQTVKTNAQNDIGNGLLRLVNAVDVTTQAVEGALTKYRQRHFSLQILQTNSQKARNWQKSLDDIIMSVENGVVIAGEVHSSSALHYLRTRDFVNSAVRPTKESIRDFEDGIKQSQLRVATELGSAIQRNEMAERQLQVTRELLSRKQESIKANKSKIADNAVRQQYLVQQRREAEYQLNDERAAAQRDRERAESNRSSAPWFGLLTFGIAAIILIKEANSLESNARQAEQRCNSLQLEIHGTEAAASALKSETETLSAGATKLQESHDCLDAQLQALRLTVSRLQSQITSLNERDREARTFLQDAVELDGFVKSLDANVGTLLRQLLGMKQKLDNLRADLTEQKDWTTTRIKNKKRLSETKRGREQTAVLLATVAQELEAVRTDIQQKCSKLLKF